MSTLQDLLAKRAALEQEIAETQKRERQEALSKIRALMADHGLTIEDLASKSSSSSKAGVSKGTKVAAKYRNSDTGDTWSGRGLQPKWLKAALASGKKLSDFAV